MAITTLDGALAGFQPPAYFQKAATPTLVAARPHSLWYLAGIPGAGTSDKTTNGGVALASPQNGQIPFTNPGAGNSYLSMLRGVTATQAGTLLLCDRLLVCGYSNTGSAAISMTSTSAQNFGAANAGTVALPARDNAGATDGAGVFAGIEVETATGAGTPTLTLGYTNSGGTGSRSATNLVNTVASSAIGAFYPIGLQAGDVGIRKVDSLTLSATWTSGAAVLVLYRILAAIECPIASVPGTPLTLASGGFPRIYDNSVPFLQFIPNTTTASSIRGHAGWTQG